jgi:uncharacterized protein
MIWMVLLVAWVIFRAVIYRRDRMRGTPYARRRLLWSGLFMIVIYLAVLIMLLGLENRFIYYPQSDRQYWQPPSSLKYEDVRLASSTGDTIHAWWCPQEGATYTIHFNHGNAGNLSNHAWIIPELRSKLKANVLIYDYPGYGKSTGSPSEPGCHAAAESAYQWLRTTKNIPPEKLLFMGQSLGASMACELATKHEHKALILLSPFTSVGDMAQEMFPIFPAKWLMRHSYDNLSKVKSYQQPLLIGHAKGDSIIPYRHAQRLYDACPSLHKVLHAIDPGDHNDLDPGYFDAVAKFVNELK